MSLKVDNSHKKIDASSLDKNKGKKRKISLGPVFLSLVLLSGCNASKLINRNSNNSTGERTSTIQMVDGERVYNIPEHSYGDSIYLDGAHKIVMADGSTLEGKRLPYEELKNVSSIGIVLKDDGNYDYINYLTGLKAINIQNFCVNKNVLDNIDGSRLPSGINIAISDIENSDDPKFNEERYAFLKDIPQIGYLRIGNETTTCDLSSDYVNELKNVDELCIYVDEYVNIKNFDFSHLKTLTIKGKPYDIAMYIGNDDLIKIADSGVEVYVDEYEKVAEISQQLDDMYNSLNIADDASEADRVSAVVGYVLDKCSYDDNIANVFKTGRSSKGLSAPFSENGELDAIFNSDSQICVNYAALTYALGKRAGLDMFFVVSNSHAWNAVELDGYTYYVDTTFLDQYELRLDVKSKNEDGSYLEVGTYSAADIFKTDDDAKKAKFYWYLENPDTLPGTVPQIDAHDLRFTPDGMNTTDIPDGAREEALGLMLEDINNADGVLIDPNGDEAMTRDQIVIANKIYRVLFNGKTYAITGASLLGILCACGVAVKSRKKKKEKLQQVISEKGMAK